MKTFNELILAIEESNVPFIRKGFAEESDTQKSIRVIVHSVSKKSDGGKFDLYSLVPPASHTTTENMAEFKKYLKQNLTERKKQGDKIVGVHCKGDPVYNKARGVRIKGQQQNLKKEETDLDEMFGIPNKIAGMFMLATVLSDGVHVVLSKNKDSIAKLEWAAYASDLNPKYIFRDHLSKTEEPMGLIRYLRQKFGSAAIHIEFEVVS